MPRRLRIGEDEGGQVEGGAHEVAVVRATEREAVHRGADDPGDLVTEADRHPGRVEQGRHLLDRAHGVVHQLSRFVDHDLEVDRDATCARQHVVTVGRARRVTGQHGEHLRLERRQRLLAEAARRQSATRNGVGPPAGHDGVPVGAIAFQQSSEQVTAELGAAQRREAEGDVHVTSIEVVGDAHVEAIAEQHPRRACAARWPAARGRPRAEPATAAGHRTGWPTWA